MGIFSNNYKDSPMKDLNQSPELSMKNEAMQTSPLRFSNSSMKSKSLPNTSSPMDEDAKPIGFILMVSPRNPRRSPSFMRRTTPFKRTNSDIASPNNVTPIKNRRLNSRLFASPVNSKMDESNQPDRDSQQYVIGYKNKFSATVSEFREGLVQNLTQNNLSESSLSVISNGSGGEPEDFILSTSPMKKFNVKRYATEFQEIEKVGQGEFGSVYKCRNRFDGCPYAIKISKKPFLKSLERNCAVKEAHANSAIGTHANVIRYFSSWIEDQRLYLQTEYCNGGSLADLITKTFQMGSQIPEKCLIKLTVQIAAGLNFFHTQGLAHLDVKPGNILISQIGHDNILENDVGVTYKLGDLGHVSQFYTQVEDGDCRYLAPEVMMDNCDYTDRADIFSLGLTLFEAARGEALPQNGIVWTNIRSGGLPLLPFYSTEFNALLKSMTSQNPLDRPSSLDLLKNTFLKPTHLKTREELSEELESEKRRLEKLERDLTHASMLIESYNSSKSKGSTTPPTFGSPPDIIVLNPPLSQLQSTPMNILSKANFHSRFGKDLNTPLKENTNEPPTKQLEQLLRSENTLPHQNYSSQVTPPKYNKKLSKRLNMDWSPN